MTHQSDMFAPDRRVHFKWQPAQGDIIQVKPGADPLFGGCVMVVEKVESWGVQAFVDVPGSGFIGGRILWTQLDFTGGKVLRLPELPG